MGDYPGSGYKMSSYGLKVYNPQETVGQWTQCCKVYYICTEKQITVHLVWFAGGFTNKAFFYVLARRCYQKESYRHNWRRGCSWYVESGETKVFRSISGNQLFSWQDHCTFELFALPCLFVNPVMIWCRRFIIETSLCITNCYYSAKGFLWVHNGNSNHQSFLFGKLVEVLAYC